MINKFLALIIHKYVCKRNGLHPSKRMNINAFSPFDARYE